jgi:hypothetical protein
MEKSDTATGGTFSAICEDSTCYFLISSVDKVGNISTPTYIGPFKLDFTPPAGIEEVRPVDSSFINDDETWVQYRWTKGQDELSGISTYHIDVSKDPYFLASNTDEFTAPSDSNSYRSSQAIGEGDFFWRIITTDIAGNADTLPQPPTQGLLFTVDTVPPEVELVIPRDDADDIVLNPTITIIFNEDMDTTTTLTTSSYTIFQEAENLNFSADFLDTTLKTPNAYVLGLAEDLKPNSTVIISVLTSVTDLAGNNMAAAHVSTFKTGDLKDTVGPVIDSIVMDPNPTDGQDTVIIQAWVTDTAVGSSGPNQCFYYINENEFDRFDMVLADGIPDSTSEKYISKLPVDTFKLGYYYLDFQANDFANPPKGSTPVVETLSVTPDTVKPELDVAILNDTTENPLRIGDTLNLKIKTSSPLNSLRLEFYYESQSLYNSFLPPPQDSIFTDIFLGGFPQGLITGVLTGTGQDTLLEPGTAVFNFSLEPASLLPKEKTFAAPNPASNEIGIYFTAGEDVTANLKVYTIDGQEVYRSEEIETVGGIRTEEFRIDVSNWPVGLYLFVLQVTNEEGRRAVVKKIFAVIR